MSLKFSCFFAALYSGCFRSPSCKESVRRWQTYLVFSIVSLVIALVSQFLVLTDNAVLDSIDQEAILNDEINCCLTYTLCAFGCWAAYAAL